MCYTKFLRGKIHRATVSEANLAYEGSITIPDDLMEAAGIQPHEAVCVWNVTSGTRFETYAITGKRESGHICINGAAAHLAQVGNIVIIAGFVYLAEEEILQHTPRIVIVDEQNKIVETRSAERQLDN